MKAFMMHIVLIYSVISKQNLTQTSKTRLQLFYPHRSDCLRLFYSIKILINQFKHIYLHER